MLGFNTRRMKEVIYSILLLILALNNSINISIYCANMQQKDTKYKKRNIKDVYNFVINGTRETVASTRERARSLERGSKKTGGVTKKKGG